ncbi:MAG: YncE family protein [Terriglobales bacterium]
MKKLAFVLSVACLSASLAFAAVPPPQARPPLKLVREIVMPATVQGRFDHIAIDIPGHRLYAAAESAHQVLIFDLRTGRYLHSIRGIVMPHAMLIRPRIQRVFITDGGRGQVRVYDRKTDRLLKAIPLKVDSDSIAYDPDAQDLFVVNGGGDAHQTFSMVSVIQTATEKKLASIRIDGDTLEAMVIDPDSGRIYINDPAKNTVVVVNRRTRKVEASWPVTRGRENVALALDATHHRLFVACRSGVLVVFDTRTGREIKSMPIGKGVDDASFDPETDRIYAQCGKPGATWVYREQPSDRYTLLGEVREGANAKNAALVPGLHRYFVLVPPAGSAPGRIDEFALPQGPQ